MVPLPILKIWYGENPNNSRVADQDTHWILESLDPDPHSNPDPGLIIRYCVEYLKLKGKIRI